MISINDHYTPTPHLLGYLGHLEQYCTPMERNDDVLFTVIISLVDCRKNAISNILFYHCAYLFVGL